MTGMGNDCKVSPAHVATPASAVQAKACPERSRRAEGERPGPRVTGTFTQPSQHGHSHPHRDFGNLDDLPFRAHPERDSADPPFLETVPPCWNQARNATTIAVPEMLYRRTSGPVTAFPESRDSRRGSAQDVRFKFHAPAVSFAAVRQNATRINHASGTPNCFLSEPGFRSMFRSMFRSVLSSRTSLRPKLPGHPGHRRWHHFRHRQMGRTAAP